MTDNKTHSNQQNTSEEDKPEAGHSADIRRRRLIKGATLAPVILSVTSRPVLGAECTISGFISGNVSDPGQSDCVGGFSPGAWRTPYRGDGNWNNTPFDPGTCKNSAKKQWTCNGYEDDGTPFFGPSTFTGSDTHYHDKTLMQVLWMKGHEDPHEFGQHIVAALCNSYAVAGYGMKPSDVLEIYSNIEAHGGPSSGYYEGANGKIMSVEDVVIFIQSTFAY